MDIQPSPISDGLSAAPPSVTGARLLKSRCGEVAYLWAALVLVLLCSLAAIAVKGSNVDEYWSIAFARDTVPWPTAFDAWSRDTGHPVGFYMTNRLLDPVLAENVIARRASNYLFVALFLVAAWHYGRKDRTPWFFAAALFAQTYMIERLAEYRATFGALVLLSILALAVRHELGSNGLQRPRVIVPALVLIWAMLLDYPIGLAGCALCSAWLIVALVQGDRKQALAPLVVGTAGLATLVVGLMNSARFPMLAAPYTVTSLGFMFGLAKVAITIPLVFAYPLYLAARKHWSFEGGDPVLRARVTVYSLALAFTMSGYFLINLINDGMIQRQLFGIIPIGALLLAEVSWPALRSSNRRSFAIALVNLLGMAALSVAWLSTKGGFERYASFLAESQRACPSLLIHGVKPVEIDGTRPPQRFPGIANPVAIGLDLTARRYGFQLSQGVPRGVDDQCGAIVWSEFFWGKAPPIEVIASRAAVEASPESLNQSRLLYIEHSLLLQIPGNESGPRLTEAKMRKGPVR